MQGVSGDLLEVPGDGAWLDFCPLLRIERGGAGSVTGLRVDSGRVKGLRLLRV